MLTFKMCDVYIYIYLYIFVILYCSFCINMKESNNYKIFRNNKFGEKEVENKIENFLFAM